MKRYFIQLSYDGTNYHGWQYQPNAISVQEVIEERLVKILGIKTPVVGCGRTDTGVHAKDYYLHFDISELKYSTDEMCFKLNNMLPNDIGILRIFEVKSDSHARFNAVSREYKYFIHHQKCPFKNAYSWLITKNLSIENMQKAGSQLLLHKDFTSFSKLHTDNKTNNCDILAFEVKNINNSQIEIKIAANRFLRNMVRSIVGTLVDVGLGKTTIEEFNQIIIAKDRAKAGTSAPAKALFLNKVVYNFNDIKV